MGEWCMDWFSKWGKGRGGGSWNPRFTRPFDDWELDEVENLLGRLCGEGVLLDKEDRVRWLESKDDNFLVKSLYKVLESNSSVCFPMKIIWNSCVKQKIIFFSWEASWGKVLTLDQIQKRGWVLANRCFLCQAHEESINHLLLHCEKTREVEKLFFTLFGVFWVFPSSVRETFLGWNGAWVGKKRRTVWKAGLLCLFWSVWKARNRIAFDSPFKGQKLLLFIYFGRRPNCL